MTDVLWNSCLFNSVVYKANKLRETLPFNLKNSHSLDMFKNGIALNVHVKFAQNSAFCLVLFYNVITKF